MPESIFMKRDIKPMPYEALTTPHEIKNEARNLFVRPRIVTD
jgi:hypothetical protein